VLEGSTKKQNEAEQKEDHTYCGLDLCALKGLNETILAFLFHMLGTCPHKSCMHHPNASDGTCEILTAFVHNWQ